MTLRLVLPDDSILLREGIARLFVEAGFEVVAQVGDPDSLLVAIREHSPDVAIVDIRMPPTHTDEGLRAAEAIRAEHGRKVGVLVLSQYVETTFALRLVADGAGGVGYDLRPPVPCPQDRRGAHRQHLLEARAAAGTRRPSPGPRGPRSTPRLMVPPR